MNRPGARCIKKPWIVFHVRLCFMSLSFVPLHHHHFCQPSFTRASDEKPLATALLEITTKHFPYHHHLCFISAFPSFFVPSPIYPLRLNVTFLLLLVVGSVFAIVGNCEDHTCLIHESSSYVSSPFFLPYFRYLPRIDLSIWTCDLMCI